MRSFYIFVIEKNSIQEIRYTFEGRKLDLPYSSSPRNVTLESSDVFNKADIPLKKIGVSTETTVLDLIKEFKGNSISFNPFPTEKRVDWMIEYRYVLKRYQISEELVDNTEEVSIETFDAEEFLIEYYQTKIVDLGFLDDEVVVLDKIEISRKSTGISCEYYRFYRTCYAKPSIIT